MAFDKDAFLSAMDSMTVIELNDLVKAIETKFDSLVTPLLGQALSGLLPVSKTLC